MVAIMGLVHARLAGQDVVALVGGATGRIGDPSGRNTERSVMEASHLQVNVEGIQETLNRILENAQDVSAELESGFLGDRVGTLADTAEPAVSAVAAVRVVNNMDW